MGVTFRKGTDKDADIIIAYLKKLADFEKLGDKCNITAEALIKLLNEENGLNILFAEKDGAAVGMMAYYFYKIATFSGKRVLYIEDIFIDQEHRGGGIGKLFFAKAREIAENQSCTRLEWKCLDWNTNAQRFYENIGGELNGNEWLTYTIDI